MSDERADLTKRPATGAAPDDPAAVDPAADDAATTTPTTAARAVAPGAAAARRARQLGGPRRPLPQPRATEDVAAVPADSAPPKPAPVAAPKSSVGKAAARPRPRPRPRPVADEPADAATTDDSTATPRRSGRVLVGAGVVLAVLLFAVGALFLVLTLTAKTGIDQQQTDRAVSAAKSDVALVTSYGYQTVDADAAKAAAVLTGQFKQQYLDSIKTVVKPQLPTTETVTTGQVDAAGLVSADSKGRQVVVLVYGQQSVTNKAQTTPRIDAFQIRVTMQLVDGTWLVSQLDQLGNNA